MIGLKKEQIQIDIETVIEIEIDIKIKIEIEIEIEMESRISNREYTRSSILVIRFHSSLFPPPLLRISRYNSK